MAGLESVRCGEPQRNLCIRQKTTNTKHKDRMTVHQVAYAEPYRSASLRHWLTSKIADVTLCWTLNLPHMEYSSN